MKTIYLRVDVSNDFRANVDDLYEEASGYGSHETPYRSVHYDLIDPPTAHDQSAECSRFIRSKDLYALLMNLQNGISSPADSDMANSLIRQLDKIRNARPARPITTQPPTGQESEE